MPQALALFTRVSRCTNLTELVEGEGKGLGKEGPSFCEPPIFIYVAPGARVRHQVRSCFVAGLLSTHTVQWHKFQALDSSALVGMMCSVLHAVLVWLDTA